MYIDADLVGSDNASEVGIEWYVGRCGGGTADAAGNVRRHLSTQRSCGRRYR